MNTKSVKRVAVIGGTRIPFARQGTAYADVSLFELLSASLKNTVNAFRLEGKSVGEVALGAVMTHSTMWNMARDAVFMSGLSPETPAIGVQRACGTGLDAAIVIANRIALGHIDSGIAGGADSSSDVPMMVHRNLARRLVKSSRASGMMGKLKPFLSLNPKELLPVPPGVVEMTTGKSMGQHCELMAQEWKIDRSAQDELALKSHQNAVKGYESRFFSDLVVPFAGLEKDNNVRADTSLEKLAKLKPSFDRSEKGTLTAGNSSPLTDGASTVLLSSEEWARAHGYQIRAYLLDCQNSAVDIGKEGLLMAPAYAVPQMLKRQGLALQDFDFYEIHEAFAAQVLCTLKAWESADFCRKKLGLQGPLGSIDRTKLNVMGGSVALGHPFAATGGRIIASLAKLLEKKGSGRGLISICTGGGMATTAILER